MSGPYRDFLVGLDPANRVQMLPKLAALYALQKARQLSWEVATEFSLRFFRKVHEQLGSSVTRLHREARFLSVITRPIPNDDENTVNGWPAVLEEQVEGPTVLHRALRTFEKFAPIVAGYCDMMLWNEAMDVMRAKQTLVDASARQQSM